MRARSVRLARRGFALPTALAAIGVLASLAVLAQLSARIAAREVAALRAEAQADAMRESLRARAALATTRTSRALLLRAPVRIGRGDTVMTVTASDWPWHRVDVAAAGEIVASEFARASVPAAWCAAIANGGPAAVASGTVRLAATSSCATLILAIDTTAFAEFALALQRDLVLAPLEDSVFIAEGEERTGVVMARRRVTVAPGATMIGLMLAPDVRVGAGATLQGAIVVADTVVVEFGATVVGDERIVLEALQGAARVRMMGRRGLLPLSPR